MKLEEEETDSIDEFMYNYEHSMDNIYQIIYLDDIRFLTTISPQLKQLYKTDIQPN